MAECSEEETLHPLGGFIVPTEEESYPWGSDGRASEDRNYNWNMMLIDYIQAENERICTFHMNEHYLPIFSLNFTE